MLNSATAKVYPENDDDCILKISLLESIMSEGNCGHCTETHFVVLN